MPATLAPPPAPAKPTPSPASTPAPAGGGSPSAPGPIEPTQESYLGDIGSELSDLDAADETAKKALAPELKQRDDKGKFTPRPEEKQKPEEKTKEETETPEVPEQAEEKPKPSNIRALGKAYDELKKERDQVYRPKLQSLEAKTKEYEKTIEQLKAQQPDVKPFQEKLSAYEKELTQLREIVRFADYKKSPEFVDKYQKPYEEAWSKAVSEVTQLSLEMEDGTARKATANDLLALANAPLDQLDDLASKWFPRSSARVIRHVEKIRDLAESQDKALEEAKKGAVGFQEKQSQAASQASEAFSKAYAGATNEITQKYAKWFAPDETDPKGNEILKKGFEYADSVFSPKGTQLTPEQKAGRLAVIRAKAANHDRLVAKVKSSNERIAELESKLAQYEESEPPTDDAGQPSRTAGISADAWEAELRKLDR